MYNTGNPVPSAALEDMADNAQTFDALVTKTEGTTTDRLGRTRRVFQQILMDMGFQPLAGSFQSGATLTQRNQVLQDETTGVFYSWNGALPKVVPAGSTPSTAGGVGAGAWVDKTDLMLRSELESGGKNISEISTLENRLLDKSHGGYLVSLPTKTGKPNKTVSDQYSDRPFIDFKEFLTTNTGVISTTKLTDAITECSSLGVDLYLSDIYDFDDAEALVPSLGCNIIGNGGIQDLALTIGVAGQKADINKTISGIKLLGSAEGSVCGIKLLDGRFLTLDGVYATNCEKVLWGLGQPISGGATPAIHCIGLVTVRNVTNVNCGHLVYLNKMIGANDLTFDDFQIFNNKSWFLKKYGIYAEQLDGIQYQGNLSHFNRNTSSSKNHVYVGSSSAQWLNFGAGNTYFEGGEDAIYIGNADKLMVDGSNMSAFCGQNTPSSVLKVVTNKFITAHISGIDGEKPSGNVIDVTSTGGGFLSLGHNTGDIDQRVGTNSEPTYFGTTDLTTIPHYGVKASGVSVVGNPTVDGLNINGSGVSKRHFNTLGSAALCNDRQQLAGAWEGSYKVLTTVTPSAFKSIIGVLDGDLNNATSTDVAGEVLVTITNSAKTKTAVYKLLYLKTNSEAPSVTVISSKSPVSTAADSPQFTAVAASAPSGAIQFYGASTISSTEVFEFTFKTSGNIRLLTR